MDQPAEIPGPTLASIAQRVVQIDHARSFPYETIVRLGRSFPEADKAFFRANYERTIGSRLYFLRDVVYDVDTGVLYSNGRPLSDHPLDEPTRRSLSGVDPSRVEALDAAAVAVLGVHQHSRGYYHWMMSDVPALAYGVAYGVAHAPLDAVLLCPELRRHELDSLQLMELADMPRKEVRPGRQYHLPRAVITDFHLMQNLFQISAATLQVFAGLRRRTTRVRTPARIYISRADASHRRVVNEAELQPLLRRFGYTTLRLDGLSLEMQINVFRSARCIIGPHGGGLTNLMFASRGAHVFELFATGYTNACFNVIAKSMRLHYWADVYPASGSTDAVRADLTVDLAAFGQTLEAIEAHMAATDELDAMYGG